MSPICSTGRPSPDPGRVGEAPERFHEHHCVSAGKPAALARAAKM